MEEDISDDEIQKLENELKTLERESGENSLISDSPTAEKKDSTLILFRELIDRKDSRKFGNLSNPELKLVRSNFNIGLFCDTQGLNGLAKYFYDKAEIDLATSLSKDAKLIDNIVTQIKKEQKAKEPSVEKKKGLFSFMSGKDKGSEQ